jgi:hypothetical protein
MRRIVLNVAKNQQRFGVTADGDDVQRVQCAAFDWEAELERRQRERASGGSAQRSTQAEAAADGTEAAADGADDEKRPRSRGCMRSERPAHRRR